jgi:hypothetical protein
MASFQRMVYTITATLTALLQASCASPWKIHGGPQECIAMCSRWGLQFAGMVGVGSQDDMGGGATACVCQVQPAPGPPGLQAGAASSLAAPITAAEAAAAVQLGQQQQGGAYLANP